MITCRVDSDSIFLYDAMKISKKQKALEILKILKTLYPDATCSLTYDSPVQLLVATILFEGQIYHKECMLR